MATTILTGAAVSSSLASTGSFGAIEMGGGSGKPLTVKGPSGDIARFQHNGSVGAVDVYSGTDGGLINVRNDGSTSTINIDARNDRILLNDDINLKLGTGGDMVLYHSGTDTLFRNNTGNFYIDQLADDKDIILRSDDGSGGVATYIQLDGSTTNTILTQPGNVGIGSYSPNDDKLLVAGNVGITGSLHVSGNITTSGSIIAKEFRTEFINQIIATSSGSTTFGDSIDDVHHFTGSMRVSSSIRVPDGAAVQAGEAGDVAMFHNGTDSFLSNSTGHLVLEQNANDKDIILKSDDGSGGSTAYLTLDGSVGYMTAQKELRFADGVSVQVGNSGDATFFHTSGNTTLQNGTGNFTIQNLTDDGDLILGCDDGSGGVTAYLTLDGSEKFVRVPDDGIRLTVGAGNDLQLLHNGSNSYIANYVGDLVLENHEADKDIIFQSDDGSGGVTSYFYLDGSSTKTIFAQSTQHADNAKATFGAAGDMEIYHDGTNSVINNTTGQLQIYNNVNDADIVLLSDDGSGGTTAYFTADGSEVRNILHEDTHLLASKKLAVGNATPSYSLSIVSPTTAYALGDAPGAHLQSSTDHRVLFKVKNTNTNTGASAPRAGFDLEVQNHKNDTVLRAILDLKQMTAAGGGGETSLTVPQHFSVLVNNSASLFETSGALESDSSPGGTEAFRVGLTGDIGINATNKLYFDGVNGAGHTYIYEASADVLDIVVGGQQMLQFVEGSTDYIRTPDNVLLGVGGAIDLYMNHNGTNSFLQNTTGQLIIKNTDTNEDIFIQGDDGGDIKTGIHIDVSEVCSVFLPNDNQTLGIGAGNDLRLFHDGTNSYIYNYAGELRIGNTVDDADTVLYGDDGSGGMRAYLTIDGSAGSVNVAGQLKINTTHDGSMYFERDGGSDWSLEHDTSQLYFYNRTINEAVFMMQHAGPVIINQGGDDAVDFRVEGNTEQYLLWTDASTDRVGIGGTSSPDSLLHISESFMEAHIGTGSLMTVFETKGTSGNSDFKIIDKDNNNARAALQVQGNGGAVEALFVGSAGNVGIGSTSPAQALDIPAGRVIVGNNYGYVQRDAAGNSATVMNQNGSDVLQIGDVNHTDIVKLKSANNTAYVQGGDDAPLLGWMVADNTVRAFAQYNSGFVIDSDSIFTLRANNTSGAQIKINNSPADGVEITGNLSGSITSTGSFGNLYIQEGGANRGFAIGNPNNQTRLFYTNGYFQFTDADNSYAGIAAESGSFYGDVGIRATKKLYFDDGEPPVAGHTYITETSADLLDFYVGGSHMFRMDEGNNVVSIPQDADAATFNIGAGSDLEMYVESGGGNTAIIRSKNADFKIMAQATDADMRFFCDDGSGGDDEYLRLDGGATSLDMFVDTRLAATKKLYFDGGGNSYIHEASADTVEIYVGGVRMLQLSEASTDYVATGDNTLLGVGNDVDFFIKHDATNSYLVNSTGHLHVSQSAQDKDIEFSINDGGNIETPMKIVGSTGAILIGQPTRFQFANDQRIYDNGSGGLRVGAASHELELYCGGSDPMKFITGGISGNERLRLETAGDLHCDGDVIAASTTISDKRLKDNIITIGNGLSLINQLRGVKFDWNKGSRKGQKDIGLIAQEVEKVLPELVRKKKMALIDDKEYLTVDYDKMVAVLVEAVKEQQVQIEELKEDINKLRGDK